MCIRDRYDTEKQLIGDRTAYVRYFFPLGAYTAYLLEYNPEERLGFGAVTMGYGWELGYILSLIHILMPVKA